MTARERYDATARDAGVEPTNAGYATWVRACARLTYDADDPLRALCENLALVSAAFAKIGEATTAVLGTAVAGVASELATLTKEIGHAANHR